MTLVAVHPLRPERRAERRPDRSLTLDEVDDLRAQFGELRGDVREGLAELRGAINTFTVGRDAAHEAIERDLANEIYTRKHTDQALKNLTDLVARWPKPKWFDDLSTSLGALEDKVTENLNELTSRVGMIEHHREQEKVDERLDKIEKKVDRVGWFMLGASVGSAGLTGAIITWLNGGAG